MTSERDTTTIYVMLAKALLGAEPCDSRGGFVLLHSIAEGLGDRAPTMIDIASHLHAVAAIGNAEVARRDARRSLVRLTAILEHRLAMNAAA